MDGAADRVWKSELTSVARVAAFLRSEGSARTENEIHEGLAMNNARVKQALSVLIAERKVVKLKAIRRGRLFPVYELRTDVGVMSTDEQIEGKMLVRHLAEQVVTQIPFSSKMSAQLRRAYVYWALQLVGSRLKGEVAWEDMPTGTCWSSAECQCAVDGALQYMKGCEYKIPGGFLRKAGDSYRITRSGGHRILKYKDPSTGKWKLHQIPEVPETSTVLGEKAYVREWMRRLRLGGGK